MIDITLTGKRTIELVVQTLKSEAPSVPVLVGAINSSDQVIVPQVSFDPGDDAYLPVPDTSVQVIDQFFNELTTQAMKSGVPGVIQVNIDPEECEDLVLSFNGATLSIVKPCGQTIKIACDTLVFAFFIVSGGVDGFFVPADYNLGDAYDTYTDGTANVYFQNNKWIIANLSGSHVYYFSIVNVEFPWLLGPGDWLIDQGEEPSPVITQANVQTALNCPCMSLSELLGLITIETAIPAVWNYLSDPVKAVILAENCPVQPLFRGISLLNNTTLNENNLLGTIDRYSFAPPRISDGAPIDGVFLDWHQAGYDATLNKRWVLMVDDVLYPNANFDTQISNATASTKGGFTGTWKLWSAKEAIALMDITHPTSATHFWPGGELVGIPHTRTEVNTDTTRCWRINNLTNGVPQVVFKTGVSQGVRTRRCYIDDEILLP